MKIKIVDSYDDMSKEAAQEIVSILRAKPDSVLGLATGSTPLGVYELLSQFCSQRKLSFRHAHTINLDEYVGLGRDDAQSYVCFMYRNLFDKIDLPAQNAYLPNGLAEDLSDECRRYSSLLQRYARDIQILGLGSNGHIGFNEPDTSFSSTTHLVDLAQTTIKDNSRFFEDVSQVPTKAITMGISEIMRAKRILLLASGANKADALFRTVRGPVSESCPASVLQLHDDCIVISDKAAASLL